MMEQKKNCKETCSRLKWKYDCLENASSKKIPPSCKQLEGACCQVTKDLRKFFWNTILAVGHCSWKSVMGLSLLPMWINRLWTLHSFSLWNTSVLWEQNSIIYFVNTFFLLKYQVVCSLCQKGLVQLTSSVTSQMTVSPKLLSVQLFSLQAFLEQSWLSSSLLLNTLALW